MTNEDEQMRLRKRSELEEILRRYNELCQKTGYPFVDDIIDMVYDVADVKISVDEQ